MIDFLNKGIMAGLIAIMGLVIIINENRCNELLNGVKETCTTNMNTLEREYNSSIESNRQHFQELINEINDKTLAVDAVNLQLQQTIVDDYKNVIPYNVWDMITTANTDRNVTLIEIRKLIKGNR